MSLEDFLGSVLDKEAELVRQWGAMDPEYGDNSWALKTDAIAKKKHLGGAVGWERLQLPDSFSNAPLAAPNADAQAQADRFKRRKILRVDDHSVEGLGVVKAFTVSYGGSSAPNADTRPSLRIAVGELEGGPRVLRADAPCTECFATGGDDGTGCGFVDMGGSRCDHGWLGRGGAKLDLGEPDSSDRRVRPADERWHAWYDG